MTGQKLWTWNFIALIAANGFLFASFHFLLPTITVYAASLGATGAQIGLIGGIFGYVPAVGHFPVLSSVRTGADRG